MANYVCDDCGENLDFDGDYAKEKGVERKSDQAWCACSRWIRPRARVYGDFMPVGEWEKQGG